MDTISVHKPTGVVQNFTKAPFTLVMSVGTEVKAVGV